MWISGRKQDFWEKSNQVHVGQRKCRLTYKADMLYDPKLHSWMWMRVSVFDIMKHFKACDSELLEFTHLFYITLFNIVIHKILRRCFCINWHSRGISASFVYLGSPLVCIRFVFSIDMGQVIQIRNCVGSTP